MGEVDAATLRQQRMTTIVQMMEQLKEELPHLSDYKLLSIEFAFDDIFADLNQE